MHTQAASCDGKETTNDPEGVGSQASSHEEGEKTTEISEIFKTSELSDKFFDETSDSPEIISSRGDITQCAELPTNEPDNLVGYNFLLLENLMVYLRGPSSHCQKEASHQ